MRLTSLLVATVVGAAGLPVHGQVARPQPGATGAIVGTVVDAVTGRPVPGAIVAVSLPPSPEALQGVAAPPAQRQFIASGTGRFVVTGVSAGPVSIAVTAPGYLQGGHGQRRPGGTTRAVVMEEGRREGPITIQLWKPAAIEGRLVDEAGEPIVRAQVRALRRSWIGGRATYLTPTSGMTDDRGVFRLAGLTPGDWVVTIPVTYDTMPASVADEYRRVTAQGGSEAQNFRASLSNSGGPLLGNTGERVGQHVMSSSTGLSSLRVADDGRGLLVYPPVFYPALSADGIETVTLVSGQELTGVELQAVPARTVSVSGVLTGPDGPAARIGVRLVPVPLVGVAPEPQFETARSATDATGAFTFLGVPPGEYEIKATIIPRPELGSATTIVTSAGGMTVTSMSAPTSMPEAPTEPTLWAAGRVSVGNRDLAGVSLTLQAGPRVTGTLEFSGTATPPTVEQRQRASISLRPVDGASIAFITPGRFDAEGRFRTAGYPSGRYVLTATGMAPGWFLQSAMLGGRDISLEPVTLESTDITGVVLTYSDRRTEITGAAIPATGGDADGVVVVFPSDLRAWARTGMNARQTAAARVNSDGRYTISGLPAGEYLIAGVPSDVEVQTGNPEFYEALVGQSTALVLSHGERRALDVRIASSRDDEAWENHVEVEQGSGPFVLERQSAQAPARDVVAPNPGTGSISGVVTLDDEARTPVRRAQVRITGSAATGISHVTSTDDQGRFVFRDLPAARYNISAGRLGFVSGTYGQTRPGTGQGAPAALVDGQHLTDIRIVMARGAVITGRVVDDVGQPVDRAQVSLMQFRTVNGERTLATAIGATVGLSQTDDRGVYRVFGLPAGEYVIAVSGRNTGGDLRRVSEAELAWAERPTGQPAPPRGPTVGAAPTYYPGTTDPAAAVVIRVNAGEERTGIDFAAGFVRTATVSGRVEMPDGTPPRIVQMRVFNEARVSNPFLISSLFARTNPDGTFSSANVPPGKYTLLARAAAATAPGASPATAPGGRPTQPAMTLWAMHEVTVDGEDVTGLTVRLAEGMTISGRVTFDGSKETPPTTLGGYTVRVFAAAAGGVSIGVPAAPVNPDGTFQIEGLTPGAYRMTLSMPARTGPLPTWTVRHILHDGNDISETVFDVRPGVDITGLNAVLTDRVTEVSGHVLDQQGRPVTDYSVLLLPVDEQFWRTGTRRRPAPQRPDTTGRFRLIDLPAGEYYLALVTQLEPDQLTDTTFLQSLIPSAIKFTLAEGEHKVQDVKLAGG